MGNKYSGNYGRGKNEALSNLGSSFWDHLRKIQDSYIHAKTDDFINGGKSKHQFYEDSKGNKIKKKWSFGESKNTTFGKKLAFAQYNKSTYATFIQNRKNQLRQEVTKDFQKRFKANLLKSTNYKIGKDNYKDMMKLLKKDYNEELIKKIEEQLYKQLDANLKQRKNLGMVESMQGKSITSIAASVLNNPSLDQINTFLTVINDIIKTFTDTDPQIVQVASNVVLGPNSNTIIANYLRTQANSLGNPKAVNADKVVAFLNRLADTFSTGQFKSSKKPISAEGLATLISNKFISEDLGENLDLTGLTIAENEWTENAKKLFEKKSEGEKFKRKQGSGQLHTLRLSDNINKEGKTTSLTVKVDKRLSDFQITVTINGRQHTFLFDLGFNIKTYTSQSSIDKNGMVTEVSMGKAGTVRDAINALAAKNETIKPMLYNIIAHSQANGVFANQTNQLIDLITRKQVIRGVLSNGNLLDFSHVILINNEIFTAWEIVDYVLNYLDLFYSHSVIRDIKTASDQGVSISIIGRKEIYEGNTWIGDANSNIPNALQRNRIVNSKINQATIEYNIHLPKLLAGLGKKQRTF